jgi:hypothetical protein
VRAWVAAGIAKGEIVHVDASLIRADVSWESLVARHVGAVAEANQDEAALLAERNDKQTGRYKKICTTDPDATMATNARNRRLEPAYKQHTVVDDVRGVVLDVEVTTGELNEGQVLLERLDATAATTGQAIITATADAGYAYAKVYSGLEKRGIDPLIPAKADPMRSAVPLRRFRFDPKADLVKCPRGKILTPGKVQKHGRFFVARTRDCRSCSLAVHCLPKGRGARAVMISIDYPALLRARRRRERWSTEDQRLYQRHRWRSEGFHGEAKTWHGLARAVRRGLGNMRIQAFLTAAAINLKRLAAALLALLWRLVTDLCRPGRPEAAAAHRQPALRPATALSPERRRAYRSNLSSSTTPRGSRETTAGRASACPWRRSRRGGSKPRSDPGIRPGRCWRF